MERDALDLITTPLFIQEGWTTFPIFSENRFESDLEELRGVVAAAQLRCDSLADGGAACGAPVAAHLDRLEAACARIFRYLVATGRIQPDGDGADARKARGYVNRLRMHVLDRSGRSALPI